MATIEELVTTNRTCRRFENSRKITADEASKLVNLGRLSASAANLQPLKYIASVSDEMNSKIFPCLKLAGYLKEWDGPEEHERPSAYIVILHDTKIAGDPGCDHGIASQSIMLGAAEKGLAGCMIASVDRKMMGEILGLSENLKILLVLALGYPVEERRIVELTEETGVRYFRDEKKVHYVPKRSMKEVLISVI